MACSALRLAVAARGLRAGYGAESERGIRRVLRSRSDRCHAVAQKDYIIDSVSIQDLVANLDLKCLLSSFAYQPSHSA